MRIDLWTPARRIRPNPRSLTGKTATGGSSVAFESSLERDWTILLDFDEDVRGYIDQPFTLSYTHEGEEHHYTPDYLADFGRLSGKSKRVVYEVKFREELRKKWQEHYPRFRAANHHCRARGWTFTILTDVEIRTPYLENVKFLRSYTKITERKDTCTRLLNALEAQGRTTPNKLLASVCDSEQARLDVLPMLWSLIATRRIACDLHQDVTMNSCIFLSERRS